MTKKYSCSYYAGVRIISTIVTRNSDGEKVQVTYYHYDNPCSNFGCEVYSGQNYIVGSTKASYSRNYKQAKGLPKEWLPVYVDLMVKAQKVDWANVDNRIDAYEF